MASNVQTLRFRRPTNNNEGDEAKKVTKKSHHTGILQDQTRRHARPPWTPSFSMAVRILLFVRFLAAMYSNISDCDEVYNYWEPLHYLDHGYGFRTWETSPVYAIRSYAYILLHWMPIRLARVIAKEKRAAFFAVRIALAMVSTLVESKFYRTVVEKINLRVGRYLFVMLLFNAGMWNASTAFLPSSLALYANTLAFSYALEPPSNANVQRTFFTTLSFAAGAIVGWPFSIIMAVPFVLEELFVRGIDHVPKDGYEQWVKVRWPRLFGAGAVSALLFVPVIAIDTLFYGRLRVAPWNIISYNLFSDSSRGPELYGTEPWYYYFLNLGLNFNVLLPLALISAPALFVTYHVDRRRLGAPGTADQSSPYTVLGLRLMPVYLWTVVLTLQPHKEERFMFPAYTMICFNAACTLYLVRGWIETAYIKVTASPYQASRTSIFRIATSSVLIYSAILSVSRICALSFYYRAPMAVMFSLESTELPRVLNVTGLLPNITTSSHDDDDEQPRIDLGPIAQFGLRVCVGKEWHRFPGNFLVPYGVDVRFVKSEFKGLIPGRFPELHKSTIGPSSVAPWGRLAGTSSIPPGMNDLNQEQLDHYVLIETCDYLVDLDFPLHPIESALEPRYAIDSANWERVDCRPFLDARHSPLVSRALWLPGKFWWDMNEYGDYCLLRSTKLEEGKIRAVKDKLEQERLTYAEGTTMV